MKCHLLLFTCIHLTSLVYLIIGVLHLQSLNIVHNSEFVDCENSVFCMWTEFDGDGDGKYDRIGTDLAMTLGDLVAKFALPFYSMTNTSKDREEHEALTILGDYGFDCQVLDKYTRILSSVSIEVLPSEIINIRYSFLPAFISANLYEQAYECRVKIMDATARFVTEDLDERSIIAQALGLIFGDRVVVAGNKTIIFD